MLWNYVMLWISAAPECQKPQYQQQTSARSIDPHLSIFLHECPEIQDVYTTLTSSFDTRLGILPRYRVVAIERTSCRRCKGMLRICEGLSV